jgi:hypothetical protein
MTAGGSDFGCAFLYPVRADGNGNADSLSIRFSIPDHLHHQPAQQEEKNERNLQRSGLWIFKRSRPHSCTIFRSAGAYRDKTCVC